MIKHKVLFLSASLSAILIQSGVKRREDLLLDCIQMYNLVCMLFLSNYGELFDSLLVLWEALLTSLSQSYPFQYLLNLASSLICKELQVFVFYCM